MYENTYDEILKAQKGDEDAMTSLVKNNLGLVYNIAKRFIGRGYEQEDLNQIGALGLIKSIKNFNTQYNVQLSTYSVPFILGEIKRYIRDDGRVKVSRSIKELGYRIKQMQKEYFNKYGEEITINKIAEELKISKEDVALAIEVNSSNIVTSINEPIYNEKTGKDIKMEDVIPDNKNQENTITDKLAITKLINELDEKEKKIVILRYYKRQTQAQVAKQLGISQVQVSRIEKRILHSMKEKLIL